VRFAPWAASWKATVLLVLVVTAARLVYLRWLCPYNLVEDEAFYWEWSRRLEWSYYSKGPGVAWTIALARWVLGDWTSPGAAEFVVRAASPVFGGMTALLLAALARDATGERRAGFFAAACFVLVPMFQVSGLLLTIDGPYAFCWAAGAWAAWRALGRGSRGAWLALGLALGIGFLYKYTIVLLVPGVVLFAAFVARRRASDGGEADGSGLARGWGWWVLAAGVVFGVCLTPVIVWNHQNHWPTLAHLLGHLGVAGGDMPVTQGRGGWTYDPMWTLSFVGTQVGMIGPAIALMGMGAWGAWMGWRARRGAGGLREAGDARHDATAGTFFLLCCAIPLLAFYFLVSFVAEPEGNWALASYLTGMCLAGLSVVRGMDALLASGKKQNATRVCWRLTIIVGMVVALVTPRLDLVGRAVQPGYEWIAARYESMTERVRDASAGPRRPLIPVHRFTGADQMGAHVARLVEQLRGETGKEAFIVALHYGRAAHLAFYTPGRPTVYCSSALMLEGRRTQYDYWAETDLRRADGLAGRPAVLVGGKTAEDWGACFERVELVRTLDGDGKRGRPAFLGYGFKGFGGVRGGMESR
jgi:4-amino-4-deoxy-L-arabinose transferase-like glycosyltransferase